MSEFVERGVFYLCHSPPYKIPEESFWEVIELIYELYGLQIRREISYANAHELVNVANSHRLCEISIEGVMSEVESGRFGDKTERCRKALHDFIFEVLQQSTTHGDVFTRNPDGTLVHPRTCYIRLVEYGLDFTNPCCFITFNYDRLLDEALSLNNHDLLGDYHVPFASVSDFPGYERFLAKKRQPKDADLLKLHGSLNWMQCRQCATIHLTYYVDYTRVPDRRCEICSRPLDPVLIAPTMPKAIGQGCFPDLWKITNDKLSEADELVVIGYSFPKGDTQAQDMFRSGLEHNRRRPSLVIVEPKPHVRTHIDMSVAEQD